jgi:hypothetical protein
MNAHNRPMPTPPSPPTPEELAQRQLDTFNDHDLEPFCAVFADDVEIIELPAGTMSLRGIDAFRARYAEVFRDRPRVHAALVGRLVMGSYVVDQESITDGDEHPPEDALAIYQVDGDRIVRMWFVVPPVSR